MSNFETLLDYVNHDAVKLVHVEAVPRSISTALGRALCEVEGVGLYVNEPFHRMQLEEF